MTNEIKEVLDNTDHVTNSTNPAGDGQSSPTIGQSERLVVVDNNGTATTATSKDMMMEKVHVIEENVVVAQQVLLESNEKMANEKDRNFSKYKPALSHLKPIRLFKSEDTSRIDQSGCISFITYGWIFSYLWATYRGFIPSDQKWSCSSYDSTAVNMARLEYLWKQEQKLAVAQSRDPSLFKVAYRMIKTRLWVACFVFFVCLVFGFIGPACLVRSLIHFAETPNTSDNKSMYNGLSIVVALTAIEFVRVITYGATWAISFRTAVRLRNAILGFLYKKLLSTRNLQDQGIGSIVNIFSNDAQRLFDAVTFLPLVLVGPLVLIGGMVYLLWLIGAWSLLGFGVFVLVVVVQSSLGITLKKYRAMAIAKSNQRVKLITEMLQSIKFIKINACECPLMERVFEVRKEEKKFLIKAGVAQSLAIAAGPVVPVVAAVATFSAYILNGNQLEASKAFSAITVFFVMVLGIRSVPYGMRFVAEASVALRTIQAYLFLTDIETIPIKHDMKDVVLEIKNAEFIREANLIPKLDFTRRRRKHGQKGDVENLMEKEKQEEKFTSVLTNVNLKLKKKQIIAVCGRVGSGKSSLLHAICNEFVLKQGQLNIGGTLAYVSQDAWIVNASLLDNVLFGEQFVQSRYQTIVEACGLKPDIDAMPNGDLTEIGERGSTLSGGQKARLALTRALYANKDIYVIDDILTSLDPKVAQHVFQHAIMGLLKSKSVLIITNNIQFFVKCDEVAFMNNGSVVDLGTHDILLSRCPEYATFCKGSEASGSDEHQIDEFQFDRLENVKVNATDTENNGITDKTNNDIASSDSLKHNDISVGAKSNLEKESLLDHISKGDKNTLMESEENFGLKPVSLSVYRTYILAMGGYCLLLLLLIAFALNTTFTIFPTVWLAEYLKSQRMSANSAINRTLLFTNGTSTAGVKRGAYITVDHLSSFATVYIVSILFMIVVSTFKAVLFVRVALKASNNLHNRTFNSVMHASMRWFESVPLGRIVNRFSKDIDDLDVKVPFNAECFLQHCFQITGYMMVIAWIFPWFLLACLPLSMIFLIFVACFRSGIRSLKRSENNSRSPLFSFIDSSIRGVTTIRTFGKLPSSLDQFKKLLDVNSGCIFMYNCAMHWLAVWLDLIVVLITFITSLMIVLLTGYVEPSYAGMVIAFAIQMSGIFQFAVRTHTEFETHLTSVERLDYYIKNSEQDPEWYSSTHPVPKDWPENGRISFEHVSLKYRPEANYALNDVNFVAESGEKIGIVGRTGSGKTSIGSILLRLYPLTEGRVTIDQLQLEHVGLHQLRSKIAAIPQDPVLFAGSVRFNLDMYRKHPDEKLWEVLEKTRLKDVIASMDHGLDSEVSESGKNMSVGQRQLICLARALLRRVKVVLMDEATATLDDRTDQLVGRCLADAFKHCTILTIAHRISTVVSVDKILLMEQGKVVEFDKVENLIKNKQSRFYEIANGYFKNKSI